MSLNGSITLQAYPEVFANSNASLSPLHIVANDVVSEFASRTFTAGTLSKFGASTPTKSRRFLRDLTPEARGEKRARSLTSNEWSDGAFRGRRLQLRQKDPVSLRSFDPQGSPRSNLLQRDGRAGFQPRRPGSIPSGVLAPEARGEKRSQSLTSNEWSDGLQGVEASAPTKIGGAQRPPFAAQFPRVVILAALQSRTSPQT